MQHLYHKFTTHLKEALLRASLLAKETQDRSVAPHHLLQSLITQHGSLAAEILHKRGVRTEQGSILSDVGDLDPDEVVFSPESKDILQKMVSLAFEYQHHYVGTEHLLAALLKNVTAKVEGILHQQKLQRRELEQELDHVLNSTSHFSDITDMFTDVAVLFGNDQKQMPGSRAQQSVLQTFAVDLTDPEVQKTIDPVIGREREIERLVQVLSRRNKNNPLLLGEPGVGKTAIVEGLARRIVEGKVPPILQNKKIYTLDLSLVVAGTMYRGEFESRLKAIMDELQASEEAIIFIDEIHTIIGAGSSTSGTLDAANILKPALARGELRCIGATTINEYRNSIQSDPALDRRFQGIMIVEPNETETYEVLRGIKDNYEKYHDVTIPDETLKTAVELSGRYLPEKHFPDKAIDLIDEASARARLRISQHQEWTQIKKLEAEIRELESEKDNLVLKEQFDQAWKIKTKQKELQQLLTDQRNRISSKQQTILITSHMVAEVVEQITGIPLNHLIEAPGKRFSHLDQKLKKIIIGQDEAIDSVTSFIGRAHVGLSKANRPLGTFMFLGPSGVGKTALVKAIAQEVFGNQQALVRIDMSEFSEKFNISKLIGAPAGYVGYKESGTLTEAVRRRPYSVVLFDEIEKAHPEVFNLLLQILDEGYVTDAVGNRVNFRNTIIIMTSNIGAEKFNAHAQIGFDEQDGSTTAVRKAFEKLKHKMTNELSSHFRPEFLNRLDKIIIFNPLSEQDLIKIVNLELQDLKNRLSKRRVKLSVDAAAKKLIAKYSYTPDKGAREIARQVQEQIEHPITARMLKDSVKHGDTIQVRVTKDKLSVTAKK